VPFRNKIDNYRKNRAKAVSSGDSTLDELMGGEGFQKDLIHLLYGDKKKCANILLTTAIMAQKPISNGGLGEEIKVAFIDANNRFNPYNVSKFAVSQNLSPKKVLDNILIARAFTCDQMVELLENRLSKLEQVKVVLISGITTLFQSYDKQTFEDLLGAINWIKTTLSKTKPLIVLTAPLNEYSLYRPNGGKILSHFGNVLIMINEDERYTEYVLVQHPYLPENRLLKWKPRIPKRNLANTTKIMTIDHWFGRTEEDEKKKDYQIKKIQQIQKKHPPKKDREKSHTREIPKSTEVNSIPKKSIGPKEQALFSRLSNINHAQKKERTIERLEDLWGKSSKPKKIYQSEEEKDKREK